MEKKDRLNIQLNAINKYISYLELIPKGANKSLAYSKIVADLRKDAGLKDIISLPISENLRKFVGIANNEEQ